MNGPLKTESDTELHSDLNYRYIRAIKSMFLKTLNDDKRSHKDINDKVGKISKLEDRLGYYAEFWLLLALGTEIAEPRHVYSSKAATLRNNALKCADYSDRIYIEYLLLTLEQHERRAARSNAALNPVIKERHRIAAYHARYRLSEFDLTV